MQWVEQKLLNIHAKTSPIRHLHFFSILSIKIHRIPTNLSFLSPFHFSISNRSDVTSCFRHFFLPFASASSSSKINITQAISSVPVTHCSVRFVRKTLEWRKQRETMRRFRGTGKYKTEGRRNILVAPSRATFSRGLEQLAWAPP